MSSAVLAPTPPGGLSEDPEGRGYTLIADRVVQRIAARAVSEVDDAAGAARQVMGLSLGSTDETTPARVDAEVDGSVVSLHVVMSVVWPRSVTGVTRQVRGHVTERVQSLTGLRVADVDIDVTDLVTATRPPARVH